MKRAESIFSTRWYLIILAISGFLPVIFVTAFSFINGVYEGAHGLNIWGLVRNLLTSVLYTVVIGMVVIRIVEWLRVNLPWSGGIFRRLVVEFFSTNLASAGTMTILSLSLYGLGCTSLPALETPFNVVQRFVLNNVVIAIMMNLLLTVIFEGTIFFRDLQIERIRAERLEREKLQSQLEVLKNQLKPHFLFNSLNVLSSLVHSDADRSEAFINAFSQVYRYVLETHQKSLVRLDREREFMEAYLFLQEIRFGKALAVEVDEQVFADEKNWLIPPLSLQLVLENVFKHNALSEETPLRLHIQREMDCIKISNSFRPRHSGTSSTGIGQENLHMRYRILDAPEPDFGQEGDWYVGYLPLIPLTHERAHS